MKPLPRIRTNCKGVTLVELIIALGVFAFLTVAAATLTIEGFRFNNRVWSHLSSQSDARRATRDLTDMLQNATTSARGAYLLETASNNELVFYADVIGDTKAEWIRYVRDGVTLKRAMVQATGRPLRYVTSTVPLLPVVNDLSGAAPIFSYYDATYTGTQPPLAQPVNRQAVRVVGVNTTVQKDDGTSLSAETRVRLRNVQ